MIALYDILLQQYPITWLAQSNTSFVKSIVLHKNIDISGPSPTLYIVMNSKYYLGTILQKALDMILIFIFKNMN